MAYNEHIIGIHQPVWVRVEKKLGDETLRHVVRATRRPDHLQPQHPPGSGLCQALQRGRYASDKFFDYEITETCGKKQLGKIVGPHHQAVRLHHRRRGAGQHQGHRAIKYSTRGAITVSIADMTVPEKKYALIAETEQRDGGDRGPVQHGLHHRRGALQAWWCDEWEKTTNDVTDALTGQSGPATTPSS